MKNYAAYLFIVTVLLLQISCKKEAKEDDKIIEFNLHSNQLIGVPQRNLDAHGKIKIKPGQTVNVEVEIPGALPGETFPKIYLHAGNPAMNNPVLLDVIVGHYHDNHVEGEVSGIRQSLLDSILNPAVDLYITVFSSDSPQGIVRGQINKKITDAYSINLSGTNEVPPVSTTASGLAVLRITSDNVLYSTIIVTNVETTDVLRTAHIYKAAAGSNGSAFINLADNVGEFGTTKMSNLDAANLQSLRNDALYVNVLSNTSPTGKLRGQIR